MIANRNLILLIIVHRQKFSPRSMSSPKIFFSEPYIVVPESFFMSKSKLVMPVENRKTRLGTMLLEADLISAVQLKVALEDQKRYSNLLLGEILAFRGWIKQETADFFAQEWLKLLAMKTTQPIGYYLKQAALLNEEQVQKILLEQQKIDLRFGEVAILQGLLKQKTIDFFLKHLLEQNHFQFEEIEQRKHTSVPKNKRSVTFSEQEMLQQMKEEVFNDADDTEMQIC